MAMKLCLSMCIALFALSTAGKMYNLDSKGSFGGQNGIKCIPSGATCFLLTNKDGEVDNRIFELLKRDLPDTFELHKRELRDKWATYPDGGGGGGFWAERFGGNKLNGHSINGVKK